MFLFTTCFGLQAQYEHRKMGRYTHCTKLWMERSASISNLLSETVRWWAGMTLRAGSQHQRFSLQWSQQKECALYDATAVFPVPTLTHMFGQGSILENCYVHITAVSDVGKQKSPEIPPRDFVSTNYKCVLSIQGSSSDSYRLYTIIL